MQSALHRRIVSLIWKIADHVHLNVFVLAVIEYLISIWQVFLSAIDNKLAPSTSFSTRLGFGCEIDGLNQEIVSRR